MITRYQWFLLLFLTMALVGANACDNGGSTAPTVDGDADTDSDSDSDGDTDSEEDTEPDTFKDVSTDDWEETNFETRCVNYCNVITTCDYEREEGHPYTEYISWFTTAEDCPADCTADFDEAKQSIITDCENYLFLLYSCEMTLDCEDWIRYQLMTEEVDTLPCGEEIQNIIDNSCWGS
ncbi:MAG: hypothetical protein JXX29_23475 [Deltaproteobacteria bacterium]|nr:hypothetical protein [Deltaproteobacteria bacterium]MBN2674662.1 hypothetical protein [Deltaproteobacteria bacterium]